MAAPRIALLDIETAPINAYAWTMFEANLCHVIEPTFMLCYSLKWLDQKTVKSRCLIDYPDYKKNKFSDKSLVTELWHDLDRADIVVAHNGDAFDIKKTNARLAVHNLGPPSTYKTIDTLKIARKHFKFDSNKLDNIARYLQLGRKLPHTGMDLWMGCMRGDPASWRIMRRYNKQDVRLLEAVYLKLRPWATGHPNLSAYHDRPGCPNCASTNVRKGGVNINKIRKTQRYGCNDCGAWYSGETVK